MSRLSLPARERTGLRRNGDSGESLWPLRLLSLAIAVTLWLLYSYSGRERPRLERVLDNVNITYNVPEDLVILDPAAEVSIRVSGAEEVVRELTPFQVSLSIDVSPVTGLQEVMLTEEMVTLPADLSVLSIVPARLSLDVDEQIEKDLKIIVSPGGSEATAGARWLAEETETRPGTIRFRGPRKILASRDAVTATIDLENRLSSFEQDVSVEPPHELVQAVGPSIVRVIVAIEPPPLPGETG